jgi:exodeoxyribonuclease VII large subunit
VVAETLTVRELCAAVGAAIDATFEAEVWVKGAISGLSRSPNGHVYFDLVEPSDDVAPSTSVVLPVALFATSRQRVNAILRKSGSVRMHDGLEIRIRGQVTYYPPQGRVQLVMSLIDPAYTMGRLALARQALLERLRTEGLLGANAAVEFPALPLRVGLITSHESAAHADFVHELEISGYAFEVDLFDARVQGLDAVGTLVDAIRAASAAGVDVVVVVRGGGARTDLAAFDHEHVARAIATCPRPVIVGVGHEIDRSVADEVAAVSAKTPTAAAAVLVDAVRRFDSEVATAADRLVALAERQLDAATIDLVAAGNHLTATASRALERHAAHLDTVVTHLDHRRERAVERAETSLDQAQVRLRALDPAAALARGWSITHTGDGELVRGAADVEPGVTLVTTTASGRLVSTVTGVQAATPTIASEDP